MLTDKLKKLIPYLMAGAITLGGVGCKKEIEKIAFTSDRDGNSEVYIMEIDGIGQENLTNNPFEDYMVAFSPDSKKIIFSSFRDYKPGKLSVRWEYEMNLDGSEQRGNTSGFTYPGRSPDGKKFAFHSNRDGNFEIYTVDILDRYSYGTTLMDLEWRNLTNNPAWDSDPAWSPDGKKIAFVSKRDGNDEIYVMNDDGSNQRNLTNDPNDDKGPAWSPDSKKIAFTSLRDINWDIYVMNADGSEQRRLTYDPALDHNPVWLRYFK